MFVVTSWGLKRNPPLINENRESGKPTKKYMYMRSSRVLQRFYIRLNNVWNTAWAKKRLVIMALQTSGVQEKINGFLGIFQKTNRVLIPGSHKCVKFVPFHLKKT